MPQGYSTQVCRELEKRFQKLSLHRPMRVKRYEPDTELKLEVKRVEDCAPAVVRIVIKA